MSIGTELRNAIPRETAVNLGQVTGYDIFLERQETRASGEGGYDRVDLRHLDTYSIDPPNAEELDDALSVEEHTVDGELEGYTAWVHIADVPSLVPEGSFLDHHARQKGRTFYYADGADSMLPWEVVELASLDQGVERPSNTVEMRFDVDGNLEGWNIYRSTVRTDANLSYDEADDLLKVERVEDELRGRMPDTDMGDYRASGTGGLTREEHGLLDDLEVLDFLATHLADKRMGSLLHDRSPSHLIVEEFMVHANYAAAEELSGRGAGIYRVNGAPDGWDVRVADYMEQAGLEEVAAEVRGSDPGSVMEMQEELGLPLLFKQESEEKDQAYYAIAPRGHEALNLDYYAPFTSPARRYEDLVNWRLLHGQSRLTDTDVEGMTVHLNKQINPSTFADEEAEFDALFD